MFRLQTISSWFGLEIVFFLILQYLSGGGKRSLCGFIPTFFSDLTVHNLKTKLPKYGTKLWKSGRHLKKLKSMLTQI